MLKDITRDIPGATYNEADLRFELPRPSARDKIKIILLGAENPAAVRGIFLDGVIFDEYAEMGAEIWTTVVRPALSDRMGWAIFLFTPRGQNHAYDLYTMAKEQDDWFVKSYKASETGIIPVPELEAAKSMMSESEYNQEFEVSFSAALVGAYYAKELEEAESKWRICEVPHEPSILCKAYFDLGVSDSTAIWIAQVLKGREVRIIDYYEDSGYGLDHYVKWLKDRGYIYEEIVLPHDAAVRELSTGKSRVEVFRSLMKGVRITVAKRDNIADGINAARMLIKKCYFDAKRCAKGILALKAYQRKWDAKNKVYNQTPLHDWSSHGADAFRTLALNLDENRADIDTYRNLPRSSKSDFSVV